MCDVAEYDIVFCCNVCICFFFCFCSFFFNDTATTEIYTLSLHDALPISMNTLNMTSMTGTGGGWEMGAGMGFHGLTWLILLLATGAAIWLLARTVGYVLVNRRK